MKYTNAMVTKMKSMYCVTRADHSAYCHPAAFLHLMDPTLIIFWSENCFAAVVWRSDFLARFPSLSRVSRMAGPAVTFILPPMLWTTCTNTLRLIAWQARRPMTWRAAREFVLHQELQVRLVHHQDQSSVSSLNTSTPSRAVTPVRRPPWPTKGTPEVITSWPPSPSHHLSSTQCLSIPDQARTLTPLPTKALGNVPGTRASLPMEGASGQAVHQTVATIPDGDCHRTIKHVDLDAEVPTTNVLLERGQITAVVGLIMWLIN